MAQLKLVGGPRDGQWFPDHGHDFVTVPDVPPLSAFDYYMITHEPIMYTVTHYKRHAIYGMDGDGKSYAIVEFYAAESMTVAEAIQHQFKKP